VARAIAAGRRRACRRSRSAPAHEAWRVGHHADHPAAFPGGRSAAAVDRPATIESTAASGARLPARSPTDGLGLLTSARITSGRCHRGGVRRGEADAGKSGGQPVAGGIARVEHHDLMWGHKLPATKAIRQHQRHLAAADRWRAESGYRSRAASRLGAHEGVASTGGGRVRSRRGRAAAPSSQAGCRARRPPSPSRLAVQTRSVPVSGENAGRTSAPSMVGDAGAAGRSNEPSPDMHRGGRSTGRSWRAAGLGSVRSAACPDQTTASVGRQNGRPCAPRAPPVSGASPSAVRPRVTWISGACLLQSRSVR